MVDREQLVGFDKELGSLGLESFSIPNQTKFHLDHLQPIITKVTESNYLTSDWFGSVELSFFVRSIGPFISNLKLDFFILIKYNKNNNSQMYQTNKFPSKNILKRNASNLPFGSCFYLKENFLSFQSHGWHGWWHGVILLSENKSHDDWQIGTRLVLTH